MTFSSDLKRFIVKTETRTNDVHLGSVSEVFRSVVFGSEITSAPGQPVDKGPLRASWQEIHETPTRALVATNSEYAIPNEEGIREDGGPYVQRSPVGGRHSVKLTIAGYGRIVEHVTKQVTGGNP